MITAAEILKFRFDPEDFGALGKTIISSSTEKTVLSHANALLAISSGFGGNISPKDQSSTLEVFYRAYRNDRLEVTFASRRLLKRLAFCLTFEDALEGRIVDDDEKLTAAITLLGPVPGAKVSWGLLIAALDSWAEARIRTMLISVLRSRIHKDPALSLHLLISSNKDFLLEENGADAIANCLIEEGKPLGDCMKRIGLPESFFATQFALTVAQCFAVSVVRSNGEGKELIEWTISRGSKDFALAVLTPLIMNATANTRSELEKAALYIIGDPGLPNEWNSENVALRKLAREIEEARKVVQCWLSERLIKLFFSKLHLDDDGRRKYWERWAKHISDIRIAVDRPNRQLLVRSDELAEYLSKRIINLRGTDSTAIIMRIADRIFVEIGATGNALYVYKEDQVSFQSAHTVRSSDLKMTWLPLLYRSSGRSIYGSKPFGRAIHRAMWQRHVDTWIRRELALEPTS